MDNKPTIKRAGALWVCVGVGVSARGKTTQTAYANWYLKIADELKRNKLDAESYRKKLMSSERARATEIREAESQLMACRASLNRVTEDWQELKKKFSEVRNGNVLIVLAMAAFRELSAVAALRKLAFIAADGRF